MKTFLKEVLLPLLIALCLAAFFKPVYMADGGISGTVGIFALNIIIGGLIGGLALIVGLLLGIIHTIREII